MAHRLSRLRSAVRYRRKRAALLRDVRLALQRGAATAPLREVDPTDPLSWEFCAFSQNGEDGILDYLTRRLLAPRRLFVEVGAGDGRENNTSWLAVAGRVPGVMVDADPRRATLGARLMRELTPYVDFRCARVTPADVADLFPCRDPDLFSVDIDGGERELIDAVLGANIRPAILVTEFDFRPGPGPIDALRAHLESAGYRFVTVESNGVNAFFVDPARFDPAFLDALRGAGYRDNPFQRRKLGAAPLADRADAP